ncbi:unnamed protein product, partial [Choristocarpus tenellus]
KGYLHLSVRVADVRYAYFRVATDRDIAASNSASFVNWATCMQARCFLHDRVIDVIQELAKQAGVPLFRCRPWVCLARRCGAIRPANTLTPAHLNLTIAEV